MEALRIVLLAFFLGLRFVVVAMFAVRGVAHVEVGCICYAVAEAAALVCALRNEWEKRSVDRSLSGLGVSLLYIGGMFVVPVGVSTDRGQFAMCFVSLVLLGCLGFLGRSYSVGHSTWLRLVDAGPYSVIRHPMLATQIVARAVVVWQFCTVVNQCTFVLFLAAKVATVLLEEKFLMECEGYRDYSERVRWRFLPGVW